MEDKGKWICLLQSIQYKHKNVGIVNDLLHQMETGKSQGPSPKQKDVINKIYEGSWYKSEIDEYFKASQSTSPVKEEMTEKLTEVTSSKVITEVDTTRYHDFLLKERKQIGFKQNITLTEPTNSYTMNTSTNNIKKTKLEEFDRIFND